MKITCNHPASSYGQPVILADDRSVMDYGAGLTMALKTLGWSRAELSHRCGYKGRARGVDRFWQGHIPPASVLNVVGLALDLRGE